jgi:uncharacterized protein (TIGR01777 family)
MAEFRYRTWLAFPAREVFEWHARPSVPERLTPPWQRLRVIERRGDIEGEGRSVMEIGIGLRRVPWVTRVSGYVRGREFRETQVTGPFRRWTHTHSFIPDGSDASYLEDRVSYELPFGTMGSQLGEYLVHRKLERVFRHRHRVLRDDLERHSRARGEGPQRILISGASGLVGKSLAAFLSSGGHLVARLVRGVADSKREDQIPWDPASGTLDPAVLEGVDVVIHLAGANISEGRWNPRRKRLILESRVRSTQALGRALSRMQVPPRVLISASAIGYYGDRGDAWTDESAVSGNGFLSEVCRAWEAATELAHDRGIRVVHLRIGVVLSARGGALAKMLTPFSVGLGGVVGSGNQYMSWVALGDLLGAIHHLMFADSVSGPVNAVAPQPVTNHEFTKTLGSVLTRPTLVPLPAPIVRMVFGELGEALLLGSARIAPSVLERSGFCFLYPSLRSTLSTELGRDYD